MNWLLARVVTLIAISLAPVASALAAEWADYATISNTMGVNSSRICIGDAATNDVGCPTYAPTVSSAGLLTINTSGDSYGIEHTNGTVRLATYVDGSRGWLGTITNSGLSFFINDSITPLTIATNGNVGIGHVVYTPSSTLHVSGTAAVTSWTAIGFNTSGRTATAPLEVNGLISTTSIRTAGIVTATYFEGNGSRLSGIATGTPDRITSGTAGVYANTAGGYISLTTGNTTWGYLGSSATYLPKVNSTYVSASGGVQAGSNALTCATGISGTMRYSGTSSTMEYCNGSAWVSMGPSATAPISFFVNKNNTNQTISAGTYTKLTWSTEVFDTNNNFASDRFTPTVPGKYLITVNSGCTGATGHCDVSIYKNGTRYSESFTFGDNYGAVNHTSLVDMNGTSDYVEAYIYIGGGTTVTGNNEISYFQGVLLAPQGGGSSSAAGNTTELQFNSSGSFGASSYLTWDNSGRNLTVSGTVQFSGSGTETCSAAGDVGKTRRNPVSGKLQACFVH